MKKGRTEVRPKSREETPKVGSDEAHQRRITSAKSMVRPTYRNAEPITNA